MAYEDIGKVDITLPASADLSASQYKFVKINTSGEAEVATARGEKVIGVLQNKPSAAGEAATVRVWGVSKVQAAEALAAGDFICTSAAGQAAKVAAAATGTGHTDTSDAGSTTDPLRGSHVMGIVVLGAGAAGRIASVLVNPMGAVPTTAV
jgi:hypothetical protein